jgi:molybdenum-dependent DNA-binding transcriptional regulator ModE
MLPRSRRTPLDTCVPLEMEAGVSLGYRKAVLLNEIGALRSMSKAAKVTGIDLCHARELVAAMNTEFSHPLVQVSTEPEREDRVALTPHGALIARAYWRRFEPIWQSIIEERSRHF